MANINTNFNHAFALVDEEIASGVSLYDMLEAATNNEGAISTDYIKILLLCDGQTSNSWLKEVYQGEAVLSKDASFNAGVTRNFYINFDNKNSDIDNIEDIFEDKELGHVLAFGNITTPTYRNVYTIFVINYQNKLFYTPLTAYHFGEPVAYATPTLTAMNTEENYSEKDKEAIEIFKVWAEEVWFENKITIESKNQHPDIIINEERKILTENNQNIIINQDNLSELITFIMPRFYDDVDLYAKPLYAYYIPVNKEDDPIKVLLYKELVRQNPSEVTPSQIKLYWIIDDLLSKTSGTINFAIIAEGENLVDNYFWQTYPAQLTVEQSIISLAEDKEFHTTSLNEWQETLQQQHDEMYEAYQNGATLRWNRISSLYEEDE